jgi:hypothetical protein
MIADIDVKKFFAKLKPGEEIHFLCEGCEMVAVMKDERGERFRGYK